MSVRCSAGVCLAACSLSVSVISADPPTKVELNLAKGDSFAYTVTIISAFADKGGQNENRQTMSIEIKYIAKVKDRLPNGDVVIEVTYASVRIKGESRLSNFELDSAKPTGDAEFANFEKAVKSVLTVSVSGNRVKEIKGFPERTPTSFGGFGRGSSAVSQFTLARHMGFFLSSPVQGVVLEKGKVYAMPRAQPATGDRKVINRDFQVDGVAGMEYTYQGNEADAAKFTVFTPAGSAAADRERGLSGEEKGTALVALKDGLLQKLELKSESEHTSVVQSGKSVTTKFSSMTTVVRTRCK